jgi:16S rRNA pseudouridine516 synthase
LKPAALEILDARHARLTLTEGRYHQARRMFAATGNHVESLHRVRVGGLELGDLPSGMWRLLDAADVARLLATSSPSAP